MQEDEPSLNIPSLLTLAVVSFFVLRWFFNRDESSSSSGGSRPRRGNAVDPGQVEQVSQMFPQLSTREIMWDLQRNGGSVAATTERILTGRGLETPPPSFQPQVVLPSRNTTTPARSTAIPATKANGQDLISRYNLGSKVSQEEPEAEGSSKSSWSQNKEERQRLLQNRRDEMILAARRKMMQKEQKPTQ